MKGNVLIIDDEAEIRRNLTVGLTQEGLSAVSCPDGISAIHELENSREKGIKYDYLITDIFMPDIDGLKILKVIKKQYPDLPVLVITGYGDVSLELEAISEHNTGYLDKPFEISELVEALKELTPGSTVSDGKKAEFEPEVRESVSAYLTIRITDKDNSMGIYKKLYYLDGVHRCEAVRGDFDIIILAQAGSQDEIDELFGRIGKMDGLEVVSVDRVERPKLDRDVNEFISIYSELVKESENVTSSKNPGTTSYVVVDIEKGSIQQIFTTVFFIDEVVFCDVIEDGSRLVGMITGQSSVGKTPRIVEKLNQIDGVLRVREAKVIKIMEE
ncbi:MAG TPA: response regulator [Candidatus Krumholzibacteriaceae bacterium]|nr:response regulator [Candidatus Krumholzibacteriaceae bacterium]